MLVRMQANEQANIAIPFLEGNLAVFTKNLDTKLSI